ncbi:MAG TPA: XRE family transcriptional regulator [Geminicoccaceae bacterium]|nr:XRE family transcriptional regulator [Geminicoccus sp.]HMU48628.1 XRE family transcriptional regulator [Geminicoccaceae bacterium]
MEIVARDRLFNPEMLLLGRDWRRLTQAGLAQRAGVTQALISQIEHGLTNPSTDVVERISDTLKLPPTFFYQQERLHGLPPYHYFRRKKVPAKTLAAITAHVNLVSMHIRKLWRSMELNPSKPIPQYDLVELSIDPVDIARMLREYWILPRGPVRDIIGLIEDAGAIIIPCDFGTYGWLDAISMRLDEIPPLIFIDKHMPSDRFNFTLAHELGHLVMHTIPQNDGTMEKQADEFASNFLMPADDIRPYLSDITLPQLTKVKMYWKVAIAALIMRAKHLDIASDYELTALWKQYNSAGYSRSEPAAFERPEPKALRNLINFHMAKLEYKAADLAKVFAIGEDELRNLYLGQPRLRLVSS